MGYTGNFFAAAEAVPLGKVAKPQALTEGVPYYNMYYFSPFSAIRAVLTPIRAEFLLFLPNLWYICGNDTPV